MLVRTETKTEDFIKTEARKENTDQRERKRKRERERERERERGRENANRQT